MDIVQRHLTQTQAHWSIRISKRKLEWTPEANTPRGGTEKTKVGQCS